MQVTMQVPVVCFLFTKERSEGFVKFSRIGFKIFCFPLPVFLDNLSSVFCSNVPPPSLYFPIFICSVVCILLGIFSFKFNCIFPTRCHVWDVRFPKTHCFSGQLSFSTMVSDRVFQKSYLSSSVSKVSMVFHGAQARSSMNLSTLKDLVLLKVTASIRLM